MIDRVSAPWLSISAVAVLLSGCATVPTPTRLESFGLGRNVTGETCVAARNWSDPATSDPFARAYALTCSGAATNRPLGTLRAISRTPEAFAAVDAQFQCGAAISVALAGVPATARRCLDRVTGLESVRIDADRGDRRYVGAASPALLPQLEEAFLVVTGARASSADVTRVPTSTVDIAALAPRAGESAPPPVVAGTSDEPNGALNITAALSQGIDLNHRGQHVKASRLLNDALSRLPASAPPAVRAEFLLETGLSDSNIRFSDAAAVHFAAADRVFAEAPVSRSAFLARKRDTYLALDALNRRSFAEALTLLDRASRPELANFQPLADPAAMRLLNQPALLSSANAVALPDTAQLSSLVLDAQMQYARSVALLGQGDMVGAGTAIEAAEAAYRPLIGERFEQPRMLWLGARVERQSGRIRARAGDYGAALSSYTRAVEMLRRSSILSGGTGSEPAIAEAELERAAVYARTGVSRAAARDAYAEATDALIASGSTALGQSIGMEDYLDLLVHEAGSTPQADTYERYFRAVQASGEPAVARQLTQLRTIVTADPAIAGAVRERDDLEREITRLRYAIAGDAETPEGAPNTSRAELEQARQAAETRLIAVDAQLARDPRYRQIDESPATLAELRQSLQPGEAFIKLTQLDRRVYGLVVTADRGFIYHVADSDAARQAVDLLAQQLRGSIDGRLDEGQLVAFDEARAYTLWRLVAGPAADVLAKAKAITVDPSGPLERLPIGALVTRYDPNIVRADGFDFSHTEFLARTASISTALSPRSFLVARALPASRAPQRFLGMGEHRAPATLTAVSANRMVDVGFGCSVQYGQLMTLSRALAPISRRELSIAAKALGADGNATMTDVSFSDTALQGRSDLDQFAVLHFATHGLEEGMWGCAKSPPALVTSFGDANSDGLLDFSEIANLRLDANLVVLSACDTAAGVRDAGLARASGQEEAGATLEGLVRAFLTANARSVLATYWQVSAEAESDAFMHAFYSSGRTATIGEALQDAQRKLIEQPEFSHPFYWAPYFLVGDSSKTMIAPEARQVASR